jgi:hypothetical protein
MSPNAGGGGGEVAGFQLMSTAVRRSPYELFGDLTPYLTFDHFTVYPPMAQWTLVNCQPCWHLVSHFCLHFFICFFKARTPRQSIQKGKEKKVIFLMISFIYKK